MGRISPTYGSGGVCQNQRSASLAFQSWLRQGSRDKRPEIQAGRHDTRNIKTIHLRSAKKLKSA